MLLVELIKTLRPHQWVKNLFVLAPLIFAEQAASQVSVQTSLAAFGIFSLLSGCVYILNDIVDVEADRQHPTKCRRPIPSGSLSLAHARVLLVTLLAGALSWAFVLAPGLGAIGLGYFTLNVGYSFSFKHIPFLDVGVIATGFILRIYGGAVAIDVPLSLWLVLCTYLLATFLALGKRKHELHFAQNVGASARRVLARYNADYIQVAMRLLAVATFLAYGAYALYGQTMASFDPRDLVWSLPFVAFGLFRFDGMTRKVHDGRSPTDLMLRDFVFVLNLACWMAVVVYTIYGR